MSFVQRNTLNRRLLVLTGVGGLLLGVARQLPEPLVVVPGILLFGVVALIGMGFVRGRPATAAAFCFGSREWSLESSGFRSGSATLPGRLPLVGLSMEIHRGDLLLRAPGLAELRLAMRWRQAKVLRREVLGRLADLRERVVEATARATGLEVRREAGEHPVLVGKLEGHAIELRRKLDAAGWTLRVAHGVEVQGKLSVQSREEGGEGVRVNDPILDMATCVRTAHPEEARRLLTGDRVREALLVVLHEHSAARMDETGVSLRVDFLDPELVRVALTDALSLVRALSGEPERPVESAVQPSVSRLPQS